MDFIGISRHRGGHLTAYVANLPTAQLISARNGQIFAPEFLYLF
ncbi:hypothetical protein BDFB_012285 [Asbolus verrucosus]|uniref:Uncharacterized protein n=1 Tax=Asbolus verrucosus TaxID=1661398 RepID=A0A482VIU2_ASBVE|nr:hypothetical protein BDFB_012285 [Asbolus verrucosus]